MVGVHLTGVQWDGGRLFILFVPFGVSIEQDSASVDRD